jgi:histidine triad (HIT) family protein
VGEETIFLRIAKGEIPAKIVYQDEDVVGFRDISPRAPVHILVVPRRAIARIDAAGPGDAELLGRLLLAAREIARREGIDKTGYRLVINNGPDGGETVPHLHVHLMGGRAMGWPPG